MEGSLPKKIIIVGGGFGGVRVALDLSDKNLPNTKIILLSDKPHFEYHAALYRVVTGRSPLEVCIPLTEIFKGKDVEVIEDVITSVDLAEKALTGNSGSHYSYNYLVLALGSETSYFDLPGFREYAFGFKSITEALKLKRHMHEMFSSCVIATDKERECSLHFVIVGGGATGVELAGELAIYTKHLAKKHQLDPKLVTIDLIQGAHRLLPSFAPEVSEKAKKRLEELGIHILLNKRVMREDIETVYLKDMQMKTKTVIWTAGVVSNHLYREIKGLSFDEKGRVVVDEYLQPIRDSSSRLRSDDNGQELSIFTDVFVIGDAAATAFAGMAQTAVHQGSFVAEVISQKLTGVVSKHYQPQKPSYAIPIGPNWAMFISDSFRLFGAFGWFLRRLVDLQFFLSILPFSKALAVFQSGKSICEQCGICSGGENL